MFCIPCKKAIELSNMGIRAVTSHATGAKHKRNCAIVVKTPDITSFFGQSSNTGVHRGGALERAPPPFGPKNGKFCLKITKFDKKIGKFSPNLIQSDLNLMRKLVLGGVKYLKYPKTFPRLRRAPPFWNLYAR